MVEKKSWNRNYDVTSRTIFRISKSFQRNTRKLYLNFLFRKEVLKFINCLSMYRKYWLNFKGLQQNSDLKT
jgi:hypothetical protein